MHQFTPHLTELAKQYGAFLAALGSALLASIGVVAALTAKSKNPNNKATRRLQHGLACLLCLSFVCFSGVEMMAEVAGLPFELDTPVTIAATTTVRTEKVEKAKATNNVTETPLRKIVTEAPATVEFAAIHRDFEIATTCVYMVSIGFLLVLMYLASYFDEELVDRSKSLTTFALTMQRLTVLGSISVSARLDEAIYKRAGFVPHLAGVSQNLWHVVIMFVLPALATCLTLAISYLWKPSGKGIPRSVWALFIFTSLITLYFFQTYLDIKPLSQFELAAQLYIVWTTGLLSIWPASNDPQWEWVKRIIKKRKQITSAANLENPSDKQTLRNHISEATEHSRQVILAPVKELQPIEITTPDLNVSDEKERKQ